MATVPSTTDLLDRASGKGLTKIAKNGFGAWLLAVSTAVIAGIQSLLELLLTPITLMIELANASISAFFLEPLGIISAGASASAEGATQFGLFGLLVAVVIVLASFWLIIQYIEQPDTTDVPIPGLITDSPIPFVGTEEEEEEEQ